MLALATAEIAVAILADIVRALRRRPLAENGTAEA